MLWRVSSKHRIRALLEIERNDRTISGELTIDDTPPMEFYGWLELMDALDGASRGTALPAELGNRIDAEATCERGEPPRRSVVDSRTDTVRG